MLIAYLILILLSGVLLALSLARFLSPKREPARPWRSEPRELPEVIGSDFDDMELADELPEMDTTKVEV